ncbi:MAG TPA: alkaline phosphatase family protein [Solirubrobacterales bacterium]
MASPKDDDARGSNGLHRCTECGARFGGDQRYCLACGARRGPLPAAVEAQISSLQRRRRGLEDPDPAAGAADGAAVGGAGAAATETAGPGATQDQREETGTGWTMPSPRAAAIAVLGMMALGIMLGSATSQIAQSAGVSTILFESPAAAPPPEEPEERAPATAGAEPEPPAEEATASALPEEEVAVPEEEAEEAPAEEPELVPFNPEEEEAVEELPPVKHVFLIVLGENGYEETFGKASTAPYLSQTLPKQGELLTNYYGVTSGVLANEIALLSGQGPTPETQLDCPNYGDLVPGTEAAEGQVEGNGCVYPASTETIVSQLVAKKLKWKAYFDDMEKGALTGQATSCRHPALGTPDLNQAPTPEDGYVTWRNPFVYFHSIVDGTECAGRDTGLEQLSADLANAKKTPAFSYIAPNVCHSGGAVACVPGQVTGPADAEEFLEKVVPAITASEAYKEGGLIAITSAQAPQAGEHADTSACCLYPAYPNVPPVEAAEGTVPGTKASGGGGRVGMLLISPYVKPGTVDEEGKFNHFTFLLTLEELFGLEKLGYTSEAALLPFDGTVFNYAEETEESTTVPRRARRGLLGRIVAGALSRAGSAGR